LRLSDEKLMGSVTITEALLPPRVNTKGKVVWRLPAEGPPRLGLHEQRAVVAEYRKQRKDRKDANRSLKVEDFLNGMPNLSHRGPRVL
ncbi:MAG: hypothetical protein AAF213_10720, partial [Pseudomonadota bacterium]